MMQSARRSKIEDGCVRKIFEGRRDRPTSSFFTVLPDKGNRQRLALARTAQLLSVFRGTRCTVTNFARKRSSSASRTSAGMRLTRESSEGKGLAAASSSAGSPLRLGATTSPRSFASLKNAASAVSSGQGTSSTAPIGGGAGAMGSAATTTSRVGRETMAAEAGIEDAPLSDTTFNRVGVASSCRRPSLSSSRSIRPFFFRRDRQSLPPVLHRPTMPAP